MFDTLIFLKNLTFLSLKIIVQTAIALCATLFLPHFDLICDLLLNRCTATWNLFVKWIHSYIDKIHDQQQNRHMKN